MENKRIRRLLRTEYREFSGDDVLVESPFAETTREGIGIQQVALALTRTKLIVATDVFPKKRIYYRAPGVDPSTETLEIVSVYPLELVTISVFREKRRQVLKARFVDGRLKYYELGGLNERYKFWFFWCEHIRKILERKFSKEIASVDSTSTLIPCKEFAFETSCKHCLVENSNKKLRLAGGAGDASCRSRTWTHKHLFMGKCYQELHDGHYRPVPFEISRADPKEIKDMLLIGNRSKIKSKNKFSRPRALAACHSNRFCCCVESEHRFNFACEFMDDSNEESCSFVKDTSGVDWFDFENDKDSVDEKCCQECGSCKTDKMMDNSDSWTTTSASIATCKPSCKKKINPIEKERGGADIKSSKAMNKQSWFNLKVNEKFVSLSNLCVKHKFRKDTVYTQTDLKKKNEKITKQTSLIRQYHRSYGISTSSYFLHGYGPWLVQPGDRISVKTPRRSRSCVNVLRRPSDPDLQIRVSRRQLATNVSLTNLSSNYLLQPTPSTNERFVLFWTTDYWYRPRSAKTAYKQTRRHLQRLQESNTQKSSIKLRSSNDFYSKSNVECMVSQVFGRSNRSRPRRRSTSSQLDRLLELETRVFLWDFDSTTLAHQLTLIDRELFLRLSGHELNVMASRKTSRDAPNFNAWIAFSHRISCLVTSEVIAEKKINHRARLIVRLLNVARKCIEINNFSSARSIIAGLQSPGIFRLKNTWGYVIRYHGSRYETMAILCEVFSNTSTSKYHEAWLKAEKNPPMIPYVGDVLARVLRVNKKIDNCKPMHTAEPTKHKQWNVSALKLNKKVRSISRILNKFVNQKNFNEKYISIHDYLCPVVKWLEQCQKYAMVYDFPRYDLAWEFLLKARYKEDRENFFLSFRLEPSYL